MTRWLDRAPRRMGDWLLLMLAAALIWQGAGALPGMLAWAAALLKVLAPFGLGLVLAYALDIPTRFFAARLYGGKRAPAIVLSYLALFAALAVLVWLVAPQLGQSLEHFLANLPAYNRTLEELLQLVQQRFGVNTAALTEVLGDSRTMIETVFTGMLGGAGQLAGAAAGAAAGAMDFFIALAVSMYLLAGKESLLHSARLALRAALPARAANTALAVCALANRTFNSYIGGQLLDALLVGVETFVLMLVLGLPYAPLIAVLVGVTNIIPVLGPFIGAAPGVLLLLLDSPWRALEFAIIILVVQQIDGNFIAPHILGGATGISGLGVLFAILAGGELFGVPGMLVAVPALAVLTALAKQAVGAGLAARGLDPETGKERQEE